MFRQAYGNDAVDRMQCFEWHGRFKSERMYLEDDMRSKRSATSATPGERIHQLVHGDRRMTINDIADVVALLDGFVQAILTSVLNMQRVSAKFVRRLLTTESKEHRIEVCQDLRQRAADDLSFMSKILTCYESWVYGYDPGTKQQSSL
ncbi:protein GVQW3-like [Octopus bimaculoides]|uniref:protein GVQW3-like n=1 Tax=Octopus bimaculoides TaxID=37653 RepID=UPI00071C2C96|nr:protein GVQW3-like [Octopus bimaculoides]|eukprot:XP_014767722.1 PREDICTED: putative uncharacterized protein FLJ37770 [Octopus bimaculoides]